jgi:membrane fusion protein (multidrug efflux system)
VNERDASRLRNGARARVTLDAHPDRAFTGELTHVVPQADRESRAFPVKVRVPNAEHVLKSGMFARVALEVAGNRQALHVPKDAVVRRAGSALVFVVDNGVARARPVRTGVSAGGLVEVLDGALTAGQEVVVVGNDTLQDGAKVRKVAAPGGSAPAKK